MDTYGGATNGNEDAGLDSEARDLAFKLLAAHALVDAQFYAELRADPARAAERLHIKLTDDDVRLISSVDWENVDRHADAIRAAISPARAAAGPLW